MPIATPAAGESKRRPRPPNLQRYSAWGLLRARLAGEGYWRPLWAGRRLEAAYDVVVVGAGGHGLATAFHLARDHGIKRIAVLEKRLVGYGNVGRNTTIVRSNYLYPENHYFYEDALRRWATLSRELNYNVMFSPRGVVDLAISDDELPAMARRGNAMRLAGIDAELMDLAALRRFCPELDLAGRDDFQIAGALVQRRGGHRAARCRGVGLCAGRGRAGCRHHRGLRGPGRARRRLVGPMAWRRRKATCRRSASCSQPPGHTGMIGSDARRAAADRDAPAAGDGDRAGQAAAQYRADLMFPSTAKSTCCSRTAAAS